MDTILRATLFYWILLFALRLIDRRAASQLTPFELLVIARWLTRPRPC